MWTAVPSCLTYALPEPAALPPIASSPYAQFGGNFGRGLGRGWVAGRAELHYLVFSPDASKLVVSRAIGQTVVIDTETGEALPALEGSEMMLTPTLRRTPSPAMVGSWR